MSSTGRLVTRFGADPLQDLEVANKRYVDNSSGGGILEILNQSNTQFDTTSTSFILIDNGGGSNLAFDVPNESGGFTFITHSQSIWGSLTTTNPTFRDENVTDTTSFVSAENAVVSTFKPTTLSITQAVDSDGDSYEGQGKASAGTASFGGNCDVTFIAIA